MAARPEQSVVPSTGTKELVESVQRIADSVVAAQREIINAVQETRANLGAAAMFGTGQARFQATSLVRTTDWTAAPDGLLLPSGAMPPRGYPQPLASDRTRPEVTGVDVEPGPLASEPTRPKARKTRSDKGVPRGPRTKAKKVSSDPSVDDDDLGPALPGRDPDPYTDEEPQGTSPSIPHRFHLPNSWEEGRKMGHKKGGLRTLRDDAYAGLARSLSETNFGGGRYEQVMVPGSMAASPGDIVDHIPSAVPGEAMRKVWRNVETLQAVEEGTAQRGMKRLARADALRRGISTMAEGGTLAQGVGAASASAAKFMGAAGVALTYGQRAYNTLQEQNAANRPYQQVLGGSINEGFGERFRKTLFRVRSGLSLNPLSGGDADKLFDGAMDIYAQDQGMRRNAEDVGLDLRRSTGMDVRDILSTFKVAARAGTESLKEIGTAFKEVTKDARSAGMNAEEARKRFASTYEQISKSVTGVQGVMMAQAQTSALTAMGHRFTGVSLDNGMNADLFTSMMTGQSPGSVWAMKNEENGALAYEAVQQKRRLDATSMLFGPQAASSLLAKFGKKVGDQLSPEEQQQMANELMRQSGTDPSNVAQALSLLGGMQGLDRNNAPLAAVQIMTGQVDTLGEMEKQVGDLKQKSSPFQVEKVDTKSGGYSGIEGPTARGYEERLRYLTETVGLDKRQAALAMQSVTSTGSITADGQAGAAARYMKQVQQTGQTDPVLEHLLKNYDNDRRYRVRTADGDKIVGNYELINNFADQARTGKVEIVKGQNSGATLAEMIGVSETMLPGYGVEPESAQQDYKGKTFKDEDHDKTGTIIVKAAPDLQRWINFQSTGMVRTESLGYPSTGAVSPDMRPTGG